MARTSEQMRIGASEVPLLFTDAGMYRLYAEKSGLIEREDTDNEAMLLGRELESGILRCSGLNVVETQPEYSTGAPLWLTVHPDAVCKDGWLVEVKTTGLTGRSDWPEDDIPEWVFLQVQAQLLASRAPGCMVVALIGGRGLKKYIVKPCSATQEVICERILTLWQYVRGEIPPPPRPDSEEYLPRPVPPVTGKVLVLDNASLEAKIARYLELREQIAAAEKESAALKTEIESAVGDAEHVRCGRYVITRKLIRQLRLDTKVVQAEPSWYKEVSYMRLDVKKGD